MQAYLRQMAPPTIKMNKMENRVQEEMLKYLDGKATWAEVKAAERAHPRELKAVYDAVSAVHPPEVLRGPHAGFVATVKASQAWLKNGSDRRSPEMKILRAQWRQEVIFQLRYSGLSVPLWVKRVSWPF